MKNYLLSIILFLAIFQMQGQVTESKRNLCFVNHERIENSTYSVSATNNVVFNELNGINGAEAVFLNTNAKKLLLVKNLDAFAPPPSFPTNAFQTLHYNSFNTKGNVVSSNFNTDSKTDYAYINSLGNIYSLVNITPTATSNYSFQIDSNGTTLSLGVGSLVNNSKLVSINIDGDPNQDLVAVGISGSGIKEFKYHPYINTVSTSTNHFSASTNTKVLSMYSGSVTNDSFDAVAADIDGNSIEELFMVSERTGDSLYVAFSVTGQLDYVYPIDATTISGLVFKNINVIDVNGDGKKEISILCKTSDGNHWIYIYTPKFNGNVFNGLGPTADAIIPLFTDVASDFKFIDVDKDGFKDIVVNKTGTGVIKVYMQNISPFTNINFDQVPRTFTINNHNGTNLSVADVDNNQRIDIISYSNANLSSIAILKNLTYKDSLIATPSKTFICPGETILLTNKLIDFQAPYYTDIAVSSTNVSSPTHTMLVNSTVGYNGSVTANYIAFYAPYNCTVTSNLIQITPRNKPTITVNAPSKLCYKEDSILTAFGANTYTWNGVAAINGNTIAIISPTANFTYSVAGTSLGCNDVVTGTVQVNPDIVATITFDKNLLCSKQTATLNAIGGVDYYWEPDGQTTQNLVVTQTLTTSQGYTVTVYDADGCSNSAHFETIFSDKCNEVTVKTGITPNSDGKNDYLYIENIENYPNNRVMVFNRWGVELYGENKYDNASVVWPKKPTDLIPGTYYYVVDLGNGDPVQKGWIEILSN